MATAAALAKSAKNARMKMRTHAEAAERRMVVGASGAALGYLESRGTLPVAVMGVPVKLAIGIGALIVEANSSGATRRLASAAADTAIAVYGYQAGKTRSFVAGDDGEM